MLATGAPAEAAPEADASRERVRRLLAECLEDAARALGEPLLRPPPREDGLGEDRIPPITGWVSTAYPPHVVELARDMLRVRLRAQGLSSSP